MSGIRSAKYRLRAFGGLSIDIYDHSTKAPATQRKALALLALLASAGERGISRDKITAFLWPESDKEQARNALSRSSCFVFAESSGRTRFRVKALCG